jgi:hypothetical protein
VGDIERDCRALFDRLAPHLPVPNALTIIIIIIIISSSTSWPRDPERMKTVRISV